MSAPEDAVPDDRPTFGQELSALLNKYSKENDSDTPDHVLANFLIGCLDAWNAGTKRRDSWYISQRKEIPGLE